MTTATICSGSDHKRWASLNATQLTNSVALTAAKIQPTVIGIAKLNNKGDKNMQTVKQKRYFIDPQTLPPGVKLEQIERVLELEESQKVQSLEATQRALKGLMST